MKNPSNVAITKENDANVSKQDTNEPQMATYTLDDAEEIPEVEPITELEPVIVERKREDVRGILSLVFLVGFFLVLIIGMLIALTNSQGDPATNVKEVILTISGILAGPLGFVIGFYFRSKEDK